jgi:hypothetical protein
MHSPPALQVDDEDPPLAVEVSDTEESRRTSPPDMTGLQGPERGVWEKKRTSGVGRGARRAPERVARVPSGADTAGPGDTVEKQGG